jgi:hypothetical protein
MTIAWAHACRGVLLGLALAAGVAAAPAVAESQSSNSSSNCSDGRCTRVETRVIEDDRGAVRGWRRVEAWDERPRRRRRAERAAPWDAGDRWPSYRRGRDADDDD